MSRYSNNKEMPKRVDYYIPLTVDVSVEYELPKEVAPPPGSAPLLVIHPSAYFTSFKTDQLSSISRYHFPKKKAVHSSRSIAIAVNFDANNGNVATVTPSLTKNAERGVATPRQAGFHHESANTQPEPANGETIDAAMQYIGLEELGSFTNGSCGGCYCSAHSWANNFCLGGNSTPLCGNYRTIVTSSSKQGNLYSRNSTGAVSKSSYGLRGNGYIFMRALPQLEGKASKIEECNLTGSKRLRTVQKNRTTDNPLVHFVHPYNAFPTLSNSNRELSTSCISNSIAPTVSPAQMGYEHEDSIHTTFVHTRSKKTGGPTLSRAHSMKLQPLPQAKMYPPSRLNFANDLNLSQPFIPFQHHLTRSCLAQGPANNNSGKTDHNKFRVLSSVL